MDGPFEEARLPDITAGKLAEKVYEKFQQESESKERCLPDGQQRCEHDLRDAEPCSETGCASRRHGQDAVELPASVATRSPTSITKPLDRPASSNLWALVEMGHDEAIAQIALDEVGQGSLISALSWLERQAQLAGALQTAPKHAQNPAGECQLDGMSAKIPFPLVSDRLPVSRHSSASVPQQTLKRPPPSKGILKASPRLERTSVWKNILSTTVGAAAFAGLRMHSSHSHLRSSRSSRARGLSLSDLKRVRFPLPDLRGAVSPEDCENSVVSETPTLVERTDHNAPCGGNGKPRALSAEDLSWLYVQACRTREQKPLAKLLTVFQQAAYQQAPRDDPLLVNFDLHDVPLSVPSIESIADVIGIHPRLAAVNCDNCELDDNALKVLIHSLLLLDTVHSLSLANNPLLSGGHGLGFICLYVENSKALRWLDLSGTRFLHDKKTAQALASALDGGGLGRASALETLILNGCMLKISVLRELLPNLRRSNLRNLHLRNNNIDSYGAMDLAILLEWGDIGAEAQASASQPPRSVCQIRYLDLGDNQIKTGAQYIGEALRRNRALEKLIISNNALDSRNVYALVYPLTMNLTLKVLDLSGNNVSAPTMDGVMAINKMFTSNNGVSELGLAKTHLDDQGVICIAEALPETTRLKRLDLSGNDGLSVGGVMALAAAMKLNTSVTFLDIQVPQSDPEIARLTNEIIMSCTRNIR